MYLDVMTTLYLKCLCYCRVEVNTSVARIIRLVIRIILFLYIGIGSVL